MDCVQEGFQLARVNFDRDSEGDRKAIEMGYYSINILDGSKNWNQLNLGKTFHILKTIFQYFYYLVIRINLFLHFP